MASSTVSLAMTSLPQSRTTTAFLKPLPVRPSKAATVAPSSSGGARKLQVRASKLKMEKAVTGLTAAALSSSMMIPEIAEAAGPGVSPSLKNFLLSIAAGGVVVSLIIGVVVGVSNFDPVKRT